MNKPFFTALTLFIFSANAAKVSFVARLSPAGSFTAQTTQIKGSAKVSGNSVTASNLEIKMDTFSTGISLRDKHLKERLESEKHPIGLCLRADGKDGKGTAKIKIKGQERNVSGAYEIKDNNLIAKFPVKISDFGITGVKYLGVGVKDDIEVTVEVPVESMPAKK